MNERIQQMIYSLNEKVGVHWTNEDKEKFAELIIQECCDIITPYNIKDGVMFDISTNLPPIYVIKKHFGVAE